MSKFHILNGDCLADQLLQTHLNYNHIIFRECLIEGDVFAENLNDFWKLRAKFIYESYQISVEEYNNKTINEFNKILNIPNNSEICLWFENDLFCQCNLWFILSVLAHRSNLKIYRVFPETINNKNIWEGFGNATIEELERNYRDKIEFCNEELHLGKSLWEAYQNFDFDKLIILSKQKSICFRYLDEVCKAHFDRFSKNNNLTRIEQVIKEITESKSLEFNEVFEEFNKRQAIYGFGDLQFRRIYNQYISTTKKI